MGEDLRDRAAGLLADGATPGDLGALASSLMRLPDTPLARRTMAALLAGDPRFVLEGDRVALARPEGRLLATPIEDLTFAVLDFETNGLSPEDRAIEIGVSCWREGREVAFFETLLDPGTPVSPFVTRLTGIRWADLQGRPTFESSLPAIARLLDGAVVVAHNLPFDRRILLIELERAGGDKCLAEPGLCTLRMARRLLPKSERKNLDTLAERFGLVFEARHRALGDARVTGALLHRLFDLAAERGPFTTLGELESLLDPAEEVAANRVEGQAPVDPRQEPE